MKTKRFFLIAVFVAAGCATKPKEREPLFELGQQTLEGKAVAAWMQGDEAAAQQQLGIGKGSADARFFAGEVAFWRGDVEAAYDAWTALLVEHPESTVARFGAARLYTIRNEVTDFESRVAPILDELDASQMDELTRVYVSLLEQTVAHRLWSRSESTQPYDAAGFGFSTKWLATPLLSPWRLGDFETVYAPEQEPTLRSEYLSPQVAVDIERNHEDTEPYWATGITVAPKLGGDGVYYLETWATVSGSDAVEFLLYGNFVGAARVWIDGQLALERDETGYTTGKRLRTLSLTPGTHRILVKVGYQRNYRDWFDLVFTPAGGRALDDAGLDFNFACVEGRSLPGCLQTAAVTGSVEFLSEAKTPGEIEHVLVTPDEVSKARDEELYLSMIASFYDSEQDHFRAAWGELEKRRPEFAAGHGAWSQQVETMWEVPSRLRDAWSTQALRRAAELDPDSIRFAEQLARELQSQGGEERVTRALLEKSMELGYRDGRLANVGPFAAWARFLADKGSQAGAEAAWRRVVELDPSHCEAARKIQSILYGRNDYPRPEEITPEHAKCPTLFESWVSTKRDEYEAELQIARRNAGRYPLQTGHQRTLARALWQRGAFEEGDAVIASSLATYPDSGALRAEVADRMFQRAAPSDVAAYLEKYRAEHGNSAWLTWKLAALEDEIPMSSLMPDGYAAAMDAVKRSHDASLSNDEAYFVVDFAAREYFDDGSRITLTHTVVRVMTKNAIDRYGEQNVPGDARVLLARTIKQDGTVRVPEETAGKSTLSMPGLAEGDFVEMAYVEFDGPQNPPSHIEGVRFFFKMRDISTLHSEYVVLGDIAEFVKLNDAPKTEKFTHDGKPAVRFLARDNPRPRAEPRGVSVEEYLPWVQMYRDGTTVGDFEYDRRRMSERIRDNLRVGWAFEEKLREWMRDAPAPDSEAFVKHLFTQAASLIASPDVGSFSTDVNHAVLEGEGDSMLVLKAALDRSGVRSDVYLARSAYQLPTELPVREFATYNNPLLRVEVPGTKEVVWLSPDGPDARYGALPPAVTGQPAVCLTCSKDERVEVPTDGFPSNQQRLTARTTLSSSGDLSGTLSYVFDGVSAASIRGGLRARTDEASRAKFIDALASGVFAGATVSGYEIVGETTPDAPLEFRIEFARAGFARDLGNGQLQVETFLFREAVASIFASLPERTTPLLVSFALQNAFSLEMKLEGFAQTQLVSQSGTQRIDGPFGDYVRTTTLDGDMLRIESEIDMPIRRVAPNEYKLFQQWALAVEQSAGVSLQLVR